MAQTGREVTCLGFGLVPIVHIHVIMNVITGLRCFSADMIALMCCLRSLGDNYFCFHTAVQGFRNHHQYHFGCTCSHRFGKCWEAAWVRFELRSARVMYRGDADATTTGFHRDFHDVINFYHIQLADFDDAVQSFYFQLVQGSAVQKHDVDASATFAVDFGKFRNQQLHQLDDLDFKIKCYRSNC